MAGGKQIGGDADCAVFAGAVGGGDCGGWRRIYRDMTSGENLKTTYKLKAGQYGYIEYSTKQLLWNQQTRI